MVHHQAHAFRVGILVEILDVEVGIWCNKVEYVELLVSEPVFPAFVPTLYKHFLQTVLGCKIDVSLYLGCCGAVCSVRLALRIVGLAQAYRGQIVGVGPCLGAHNHVPPYSTVFCRVNP